MRNKHINSSSQEFLPKEKTYQKYNQLIVQKKKNALRNYVHYAQSLSPVTTLQPMDCSLPGSSVHGVLQARILEWVAVPVSRGSSQSRVWMNPCLHIASKSFTYWATREAPEEL